MNLLLFSCILMVLFPVHPHKDSPGLVCTNDFINNVTCTWNSSKNDSGEDCWISGVKEMRKSLPIMQKCKLEQHNNSPPGCSFAFEKNEFSPSEKMPNISVECNGMVVEKIMNYFLRNHIKMHPPDAPNVTLTANETWISWSPGKSISDLFKSKFDFEVQVTKINYSWKDAMTFPTSQLELKRSSLQLKGHQQIRVRVKPTNRESQWSNWSPTTSWVGPADRLDETDDREMWLEHTPLIVGIIVALCFIVLVLLFSYKKCESSFLTLKPVPNPSHYFSSLHSIHGGNLKAWLNPLPVPESFFTPQSCDQMTSVEVCKNWNGVPLLTPSSGSHSAQLNVYGYPPSDPSTSGFACSSSLSDYSNTDYFTSSSSGGSAGTDPAYFKHRDDFYNLPNKYKYCPSLFLPLRSSPSYESLKSVPRSPDSGFGIAMEKETEVTRYTDTDGENYSHDLTSAGFLPPVVLHVSSHTCSASISQASSHPPAVPQMFSQAEPSDTSAAWLVSGTVCRSSSMPVEHSKTGYLTLNELHTTFSNKSI